MSRDDLLTTGQAAVLLGSSRQHVVDMCDSGRLAYVRIGTHRRLRRADLDAVLRPARTRDQAKALWLHQAVVGRLVADPDGVLAKARANLERLREVHADGMSRVWLDRWGATLDEGVDKVIEVLTSRSADATEMRQNSPFAGVLSEHERRTVLRAFAAHWRPASRS